MIRQKNNELQKDEPVGRGRYRILRQIGHGGAGCVYLAVRLRDGRKAAVKETDRVGGTAEAQVMKEIAEPGRAGIPKLYETEMRRGGRMLLIMEYISGTDLRTYMNHLPEEGLSAEEVIDWSVQICDILAYLHSRVPPVIYRDLKPSNLMLSENGNVFLVDFGSARYFKGNLREDTERLGTRGYAAPEQFGAMGESDVRTDIYGFGKVLQQMAERITLEKSPPERQVRTALEQLANWCCMPERDDRPPDINTVLSELKNLRHRGRRRLKTVNVKIIRRMLGTAAAFALAAAPLTVGLRSLSGQAQGMVKTLQADDQVSAQAYSGAAGADYLQEAAKQAVIGELSETPADGQIYERLLNDTLADDVITEDELNRMEQCFYSIPKRNNSGGMTALDLFKWKNPSDFDAFMCDYAAACFFCLEEGRTKGTILSDGIRDEDSLSTAQREQLYIIRALESGDGQIIWQALSAFTMNHSAEKEKEIRLFYLESMYNEQISLIIVSWAEDASFKIGAEEVDRFLGDMEAYMKESDSADFPDGKSGSRIEDGSEGDTEGSSEDNAEGGFEGNTKDGSDDNAQSSPSLAWQKLRAENEELLKSVRTIRQTR